MTKRIQKKIHNCINCNKPLPENSTANRKFCNNKTCGVAWRTKNVYRYKYTFAHRSSSPRNFLMSLRNKKGGVRKELSLDYLLKLFEDQRGLCAISGIPMTYIAGEGRVGTNISIDRINPNIGYKEDNIQLVTRDVNIFKGQMTMDELYDLCTLILKNRGANDQT